MNDAIEASASEAESHRSELVHVPSADSVVTRHLERCAACRDRLEQQRAAIAVTARLGTVTAPPTLRAAARGAVLDRERRQRAAGVVARLWALAAGALLFLGAAWAIGGADRRPAWTERMAEAEVASFARHLHEAVPFLSGRGTIGAAGAVWDRPPELLMMREILSEESGR